MIAKALFGDLQLAALKLRGLALEALEHKMADAHARTTAKASFGELQLAALKLRGLALEHKMADAHARTTEYSSHNSGFLKSGVLYRLVPARAHHEVPS